MKTRITFIIGIGIVLTMALILAGCSEDTPVAPQENDSSVQLGKLDSSFMSEFEKGVEITNQDGSIVPAEIAEVISGESSISFWPYTGTALTDTPVDPINLVFKGQADPLQIRQALMSLDGDRTDFGIPAIPPLNLPWTDAVGGDVQTTYLTEGGWEGCVIQLTLGEYTGLRLHVRLFGTGLDDGDGGTWTLGGAHFEMMIPGTSEHQVLSWELAEQIVMVDMVRCGLLAANPASTGMINAAPSFRGIPPFIYNPLVDDPEGQMLLTVLGYPLEYQSTDYPLPSDGEGTLFQLGGALPVSDDYYTNTVIIEYGQAIPRPVCNDGPYDWLYVTGPLTFTTRVDVSARAGYRYKSTYDGILTAVPIDISTFEPIGVPFDAQIKGRQMGRTDMRARMVKSWDKRLAMQQGAPELLLESLQVGTIGAVRYRLLERCFGE